MIVLAKVGVVGTATTVALALCLVTVSTVLAASEFAASQTRAISPVFDGIKGYMRIRTDPPTEAFVTYVHPTQADVGATGGDFVAIGTANGNGVNNCADDYDPLWSGYYDGRIGGVYFCEDFNLDHFGIGDNPAFRIYYTSCGTGGPRQWTLVFAGNRHACLNMGTAAAQRLTLGLEVVGSSIDRNIDVKYTSLYRNQTNSYDWQVLGKPAPSDFIIDPNYDYDWVSNTSQNFYLPPLD